MTIILPVLLASFIALDAPFVHAQLPPIMGRWKSPSGELEVVAHSRGIDELRYVTVQDAGTPASAINLCEFLRDVDILISSDDNWIAVNDYVGSAEARLRMFHRERGLKFREEIAPTVADRAVAFAKKILTPEARKALGRVDHFYLIAFAFSEKSDALLIQMSEYNGVDATVGDWFCVYDLANKNVSLDLGIMNRGAIRSGR